MPEWVWVVKLGRAPQEVRIEITGALVNHEVCWNDRLVITSVAENDRTDAFRPSLLADRHGNRLSGARLVALVAALLLIPQGASPAQEKAQAPDAGTPATAPASAQPTAGKIVISRINRDFLQSAGSCVLSSYTIAANYFTGQPVTTYFEGYCRHFGLSFTNALDAEEKYAEHFDQEWRKRDCRGYEVILDLHEHSKVKCFAEARQRFDGRFYLDSAGHMEELEALLKQKAAFLNITYEPGQDYHSITVVYDGTRFMARDTNRKGLSVLPGLAKIGKLRDSVLYVGK
jgi:hypothetical protein